MGILSLQPLQRYFEALYLLEPLANVDDFVSFDDNGARETVYARLEADALELRICLPGSVKALEPGSDQLPAGALALADLWAQVIEGVSHFVLLAERARIELPTTHLELELQAEIDKFLLLARPFETTPACSWVHEALFGSGGYLHSPETESGARYRFVSRMAARYTQALCRTECGGSARRQLQRFFRAGQTEKLSMVLAA